jgi:hypothetical protein
LAQAQPVLVQVQLSQVRSVQVQERLVDDMATSVGMKKRTGVTTEESIGSVAPGGLNVRADPFGERSAAGVR